MNSAFWVSIVLYRSIIAIIGFGFAYLGFRLLSVKSGQQRDEVKEMPQTFMANLKKLDSGYGFTLFGSLIVTLCLLQELWFDLDKLLITKNVGLINPASTFSQDTISPSLLGIGMLVTTIMLAFLTAWYAWSTHRYVLLVKKQMQLQTDPCVIAYTRDKSDILLEIVIENIGRGIAENISFKRSEKDSEDQWSKLFKGPTSTPLGNTILKEGIPRLRPGGKVIIEWDRKHATGLASLLINGLYITCNFKRSGKRPEGEVSPVDCFLETGSHINQKWE